MMIWPEGLAVLTAVALVTRRLLGLSSRHPKRKLPLPGAHGRLYQSVKLELDAQSAILAVSLNEAMEAHECGEHEVAWSTLHLMSAAQWTRQADTLELLVRAMRDHLPLARVTLAARTLLPKLFKSEAMQGYLALHDTADQFLFRGKPRFSLHLRTLEEALGLLTSDFLEAQPGPLLEPGPDLWVRLDHDFHDFDLLTKETELAVESFIACLPSNSLESFAVEVRPALLQGVRASGQHYDA
ncbi:MAG TPA: hypothetical protein VGZ29_12465 [Terriglobia bacterium]|nr:hypothetical protein [Terriglobia bacterium]